MGDLAILVAALFLFASAYTLVNDGHLELMLYAFKPCERMVNVYGFWSLGCR